MVFFISSEFNIIFNFIFIIWFQHVLFNYYKKILLGTFNLIKLKLNNDN